MDDEARVSEGAEAPDAAETVMGLLAEHVPLTLLADLAVSEPGSEAILRSEGLPEDAWWEGGEEAPAAGGDGDEPGAREVEEDARTAPDAAPDPRSA